jgi:DNA (cytosine-5)-methyltransferase 1
MRYVSLFAGIGGFDLALNRLGHTCVWASEWDKYAAQIYNKNFGTQQGQEGHSGDTETTLRESAGLCDTRDITTVPTSDIPDHDLLVGGFPCQAFSIAGKRQGFNDTRGTLFFDVARILKDKRPGYFIFENVKGLLSHDTGKTFQTILTVLTDIGYELQWQVLNSKNFGVPQNRERVFIVGHLRGQPRPKVFPITTGSTEYIPQDSQGDDLMGKKVTYHLAHTLQTSYKHRGSYIRTDEQNTFERGIKPDNTNTIRRTSYTDGVRIRRLTPLECERLQGFPDGHTEGISDTQRYKCLGNAVTVNVVYEVARRLDG